MQTPEKKLPLIRFIKVQPQYRVNVHSTPIVPCLTICGDWLQKAGFEPGQLSRITVLNKILIVRVDEDLLSQDGKF